MCAEHHPALGGSTSVREPHAGNRRLKLALLLEEVEVAVPLHSGVVQGMRATLAVGEAGSLRKSMRTVSRRPARRSPGRRQTRARPDPSLLAGSCASMARPAGLAPALDPHTRLLRPDYPLETD